MHSLFLPSALNWIWSTNSPLEHHEFWFQKSNQHTLTCETRPETWDLNPTSRTSNRKQTHIQQHQSHISLSSNTHRYIRYAVRLCVWWWSFICGVWTGGDSNQPVSDELRAHLRVFRISPRYDVPFIQSTIGRATRKINSV